MAFRSFKSIESNTVVTLPNALTAGRAVGGILLGAGMARYNLDPAFVAGSAAALAVTDAEGSLIGATKRLPRVQKALRIIPSTIGRRADPIADKIFAMFVFAGGMANNSIPGQHAGPILATEFATAAATGYAKLRGIEPEVSKIGKVGMVARCATLGFDLSAVATEGTFHDRLAIAGNVSAGTAFVLGALSCIDIVHQARAGTQPEAETAIAANLL